VELEEVYRIHGPYVRCVCYSFVKNWDDADDLMQDTFVTVIMKQTTYNEKTLRTWLYAIAKYECKYFLLRRRPVNFDDVPEIAVDHLHEIEAGELVRNRTAGFITDLCNRLQTQFA